MNNWLKDQTTASQMLSHVSPSKSKISNDLQALVVALQDSGKAATNNCESEIPRLDKMLLNDKILMLSLFWCGAASACIRKGITFEDHSSMLVTGLSKSLGSDNFVCAQNDGILLLPQM